MTQTKKKLLLLLPLFAVLFAAALLLAPRALATDYTITGVAPNNWSNLPSPLELETGDTLTISAGAGSPDPFTIQVTGNHATITGSAIKYSNVYIEVDASVAHLTLDNLMLTAPAGNPALRLKGTTTLTIGQNDVTLTGGNAIIDSSVDSRSGILCDGNATITGPGALHAIGGEGSIGAADGGAGIKGTVTNSGNITATGGNSDGGGGSGGAGMEGTVTNSGNITATGGSGGVGGGGGAGIQGNVTNSGSITAKGGDNGGGVTSGVAIGGSVTLTATSYADHPLLVLENGADIASTCTVSRDLPGIIAHGSQGGNLTEVTTTPVFVPIGVGEIILVQLQNFTLPTAADYTHDFLPLTLTDPTGVIVNGDGIASFSRLVVQPNRLHAENTCKACDEIRRRNPLAVYDIALTQGHSGSVGVFIPFSGSGTGGAYTVLHCNNGVLEEQSATYQNGGVTTTWKKLSPFAVVTGASVSVPENTVVDPPKTGDAPTGGMVGVGMLLCALGLAVAVRRKKA